MTYQQFQMRQQALSM